MNRTQFSIVKTFQKMGVAPNDLAVAFKEDKDKILKAYAANNYDKFRNDDFDMMEWLAGIRDETA